MEAVVQAFVAAIASFIFVSVLSAVLLLIFRCRRKEKEQSFTAGAPIPTLRSSYSGTTSWTGPVAIDDRATFDPSLDRMSMSELVTATRNFTSDGIIGEGGFGFVYKARLKSGATVAVKRLAADALQGFREFRAEMETLGRIRHPNLIRLLGFCSAGRDRILIYEFLERGSLDCWLHDPTSFAEDDFENSGTLLPWPTRLKIVRGVAEGLAYLHDGCHPQIIHRDIKASNVLLDAEFRSRITDFGLARLVDSSRSHVSTLVAGTIGYMPPEYREGLTGASVRADVYSFGVLMLEVATGRRPNLAVKDDRGKETGFVGWARLMIEMGRGMEILDPLMGRGMEILDPKMGLNGLVEEEVMGYLDVGFKCTEDDKLMRPTMSKVVLSLNKL